MEAAIYTKKERQHFGDDISGGCWWKSNDLRMPNDSCWDFK